MAAFSVQMIDIEYLSYEARVSEVEARDLDEAHDIAQRYLATDGFADRVGIYTNGHVTHAYDKANPVPSPVPPVVYRNWCGDTVSISASGADRGGWDLRIVRQVAAPVGTPERRTTADRTEWFETTADLRAVREREAKMARSWGYRLVREAVAA